MRELTIRVSFLKHSLGNAKDRDAGRFRFTRNPDGRVMFLATWHASNMRFAAQVLNRHQATVGKIVWDIAVDGIVNHDAWYRRYYQSGGKPRYVLHEAFVPGQVIGFNCVVPATIPDEDVWRLMQIAGQYRGLSPARPGEYGQFQVVSVRPRRPAKEVADETGPVQGKPRTSPGPVAGVDSDACA